MNSKPIIRKELHFPVDILWITNGIDGLINAWQTIMFRTRTIWFHTNFFFTVLTTENKTYREFGTQKIVSILFNGKYLRMNTNGARDSIENFLFLFWFTKALSFSLFGLTWLTISLSFTLFDFAITFWLTAANGLNFTLFDEETTYTQISGLRSKY